MATEPDSLPSDTDPSPGSLRPEEVADRAEIAADDAGASAFAEAAGRRNDDESNPTTEGSGAMPTDVQGDEVDPGAG